MLTKTNDPDFVKDTKCGAVINNNKNAFNRYKQQRAELQRAAEVDKKINKIESELSEIKSLIKELLTRE